MPIIIQVFAAPWITQGRANIQKRSEAARTPSRPSGDPLLYRIVAKAKMVYFTHVGCEHFRYTKEQQANHLTRWAAWFAQQREGGSSLCTSLTTPARPGGGTCRNHISRAPLTRLLSRPDPAAGSLPQQGSTCLPN